MHVRYVLVRPMMMMTGDGEGGEKKEKIKKMTTMNQKRQKDIKIPVVID